MNKQGIIFNIILTVVSLALAFANLPLFKQYVDILLTVALAGNVILHIWFPGQNTTTIVTPANSTSTTTVETPPTDPVV